MRKIVPVVLALVLGIAAGAGGVLLLGQRTDEPALPQECTDNRWARGDLLDDTALVARAWTGIDGLVREIDGSFPELGRSCLLFAGTTPIGPTVAFLDDTYGTDRAAVRLYEVQVPTDPQAPLDAAAAMHGVYAFNDQAAGSVLPLSGLYLTPRRWETTAVTALSSADGFATAAPATRVTDGVFDVGIAPRPGSRPEDPDVLLLVDTAEVGALGIAIPTGPERDFPLPARATYEVHVERVGNVDVDGLRAVGPAVSAMSADPRYALVRDLQQRPTGLLAQIGPQGVSITPGGSATAALLPPFTFPTPA